MPCRVYNSIITLRATKMATPDIEIIEKIDERIKVHIPSMYKVILHNDNTTTVDFVIHVLMRIFHKTLEEALAITQLVHENGQGIAGSPYTKEIAEEKSLETIGIARANNFPLVATYEEV
jgi:ATP-dependent Clp protease adaptor protein ClpS